MDESLDSRLKIIDEKLTQIELGVEKTRKYLWWGIVLQLGMVLVPLLLIMIAVPFLLSTLSGAYDGLL
ncbi:MAG: hypothetical protein E6P95_04520 [Candidatus Moraniibacteriota bacterium]|nr:MAG: hypothetical protein E6P95_04520 [Candidatus Moranbacteria bacterium]